MGRCCRNKISRQKLSHRFYVTDGFFVLILERKSGRQIIVLLSALEDIVMIFDDTVALRIQIRRLLPGGERKLLG